MLWRRIGTGALLLALALQAHGKDWTDGQDSVAIRAGWIYTLSGDGKTSEVIENGILLVQGGKVAAVGHDLELPPGTKVLDCSDSVIIPALVAADTRLVPAAGGKETISAKYHALDGFDSAGDFKAYLSGGVVTAYLAPSGKRLVSGVGSVVKLGGPCGPGRVIRDGGDLCVVLGEGAFNPPTLQEYPLPASSENKIEPGQQQRPTSRLGMYLALREVFEEARAYHAGRSREGVPSMEEFDYNLECLGAALAKKPWLRISAMRGQDIEGAVGLLDALGMRGYLVGALEAHKALEGLKRAKVAVVLEMPISLNKPGRDIGLARDVLDSRLETAARLSEAGIPFALAAPPPDAVGDLMMAAAAAVRGGLCPMKALAAVTRVPAEILGVSHRVGSLTPGKDADFLVLSGKPLKVNTHVMKVFASGAEVFNHPAVAKAMVIRAGRILTAAGPDLTDGEILIEDGKISAVGHRVPHPPGARLMDAGPHAVVTPGFIDGHGHLGLKGDRTTPGADISPAEAIALPGQEFDKVAAAGVTTVVVAPRAASTKGVQVSAVKTGATGRSDLVVDKLAALKFTFRNQDPLLGFKSLQGTLKAGKDYADKWTKYYEALKKWEEEEAKKKADGPKSKDEEAAKKEAVEKVEEEEVVEEKAVDPVTGTWEYEVTGDPLPQPMKGMLKLKLNGTAITGTGTMFFRGEEEVALEGTLEGTHVHIELDVETPVGKPTIDADLDAPDHMIGKVVLGQYMELDLMGERTEKDEPKISVTTRKKKKKDGRPEPPKRNEALEPFRPLLAGKIAALVEVGSAQEIEAVLKVFVEEYKLPLGLLGAEEAYKAAEQLRKAGVSVVVPKTVMSVKDGRPFVLADTLAREGVPVIFQSGAEDGARTLPLNAAYFVRQGMSAGDALKALTVHPAKLYRIDDRVGTLEKGKDADLIIFSGDPFEIGSRVLHVFVSGMEVRK